MKKRAVIVFLCLLLGGCSGRSSEIETGMELRSKLLQASECSFDAEITADYGDKIHTFAMHCRMDPKGDVRFRIAQPDTISGISGTLSGHGGELTFEDTALHFELLAEEQLSPISAPWILMRTLRSGYITSACEENGCVRLSIDDSYEEDPLRLDIWLNQQQVPEHAEILYDGRRILSVDVANFQIL